MATPFLNLVLKLQLQKLAAVYGDY